MAQKDAISLIKEDHKTVEKLLDQLGRARKGDRREELLQKVKMELMVHTVLEEELLYPLVDETLKTKEAHMMVLESNEEHELVEKAISDIEEAKIDSDEFQAKAHVLKEIVMHHANEEEEKMLPKMKDRMKKERLEQMGEEIQSRKKELVEQYQREGMVVSR